VTLILSGYRVATKIFEDFGGALCKEIIIGWESIVHYTRPGTCIIIHYTRPGSSIKRPTPNKLATQNHINWPVVYLKSSFKINDTVLAAFPQNLQRIFVVTLLEGILTCLLIPDQDLCPILYLAAIV